jgi:RNA polymerase sigma factor (sigma-70 family)
MDGSAVSDAELLGQSRAGSRTAFTELYSRHHAAARRVARTYPRAGDPDDLVNEAFARVLAALGRGAGPDEAFRAYLFVTLRRLAVEQIARVGDELVAEVPEPARTEAQSPALDPVERGMVISAYESLPDQWQSVLWQTAVEGRQPRELAALLGISGNAASALAYRAREKLRQAYLQAHLQAEPHPECEPHRSRLGAYTRGGLSRRDRDKTEAHLVGCGSCRALLAELADVNNLLVRSLFPLFVASAPAVAAAAAAGGAAAGGAAAGAGGPATGGAGAGGAARRVLTKAQSNPGVAGATLLAIAALVASLAAALTGDDAAPPELVAPVDGEAPAPASDDARPVVPSIEADDDAVLPPPTTVAPSPRPADEPTPSASEPAAPADEPAASEAVTGPPAGPTQAPTRALPPSPPAPAPPGGPSPAAPPTTGASEPGLSLVLWFGDVRLLEVTLADPG